MPSKNIVKEYRSNSFYHIYNRGVAKQEIFLDDQDYRIFLNYLKVCLSPELKEDEIQDDFPSSQTLRLRRLNLSKYVELLAYCLMPNHFHLFVFQKSEFALRDLMRSIATGYVMYFNQKYDRVGPLFQGTYKASLIDQEDYLWHISRYIHLNPESLGVEPGEYSYSSYKNYLGKRESEWVKTDRILAMHQEYKNSYAEFVMDYANYGKTLDLIEIELADH